MPDWVRRLHLTEENGIRNVDVILKEPVERGGSWVCRYEIGWPDGAKGGEGWGADAVQAAYIAMQMVALKLYSSTYHDAGRLYWEKPGQGYGFPMPKPGREDLIGDDRESQV